MNEKVNSSQLQTLKKSIDTLLLIELVKAGATYEQIRKVMGSVDNNTVSAVKTAINSRRKT